MYPELVAQLGSGAVPPPISPGGSTTQVTASGEKSDVNFFKYFIYLLLLGGAIWLYNQYTEEQTENRRRASQMEQELYQKEQELKAKEKAIYNSNITSKIKELEDDLGDLYVELGVERDNLSKAKEYNIFRTVEQREMAVRAVLNKIKVLESKRSDIEEKISALKKKLK
jgi:hypothetical protein